MRLAQPFVVSVLLVVLGGLYAIGIGLSVSRSLAVFWALVVVLWAIRVASTREEKTGGRATLFGALICAGYIIVASIVFYRDSARWLWWMIIVNILVDYFVKFRRQTNHGQP